MALSKIFQHFLRRMTLIDHDGFGINCEPSLNNVIIINIFVLELYVSLVRYLLSSTILLCVVI